MAKSFKFYDIRDMMAEHPEAKYYISIGERSNGKTYSSLDYALVNYKKNKEQFAYLRRWGEDIRPKNLASLFDSHLSNGRIVDLFGPTYNSLEYSSGRFNLTKRNEEGKKDSEVEPVCIGRAFDLNGMEHYKSIAFPEITTVIFDEFLSRNGYIPNEFILFENALSTIIRHRDNVKILMLGNTVNKYCPYFEEMGLIHINKQAQGSIDVYRYGSSSLEVVVEYCESVKKSGGKKSDVYFAFDNPELKMITDGTWEIGIYPHLPVKYKPKDVAATFFIKFNREILHGDVVSVNNEAPFIFFHRKTTDIQSDRDIVYTTIPDSNPYHRFGLYNQPDRLSVFLRRCILEGRIFYATNEVGEVFRNYLLWSARERGTIG